MEAQGKGMLKVTSILFIVFGGIAVLFSLIALFGAAVASAAMLGLGGIMVVVTVIMLISSAASLVIGIIGLKKFDDPAKANFFIITGIVLCAVNLISMIMSFEVTSLIGFVLPILYIVGGFQNKNSVQQTQDM